jgi:ankyrin repeat protein
MHSAAREGNCNQLRALLAKGNDPNDTDKLARTPLHLACWAGNVEIISILLDARATDVNAKAKDDFTPLHFAVTAKQNAEEIIKLLTAAKSKKVDLNARMKKGRKTALHIAASKGNVGVCRALLEAGAEIAAKTSLKQTPLDLADETNSELVRILTRTFLKAQQDTAGAEATSATTTLPAEASAQVLTAVISPETLSTKREQGIAEEEPKQKKQKKATDVIKLSFDHLM